jgi:hypothetical protein
LEADAVAQPPGKLKAPPGGLRASGRQEHPEPSGTEQADARPLSQDQPRWGDVAAIEALFVDLFIKA